MPQNKLRGKEQEEALRSLGHEYDNARSVLRYAITDANDPDLALSSRGFLDNSGIFADRLGRARTG